jgi:hypothetical protein
VRNYGKVFHLSKHSNWNSCCFARGWRDSLGFLRGPVGNLELRYRSDVWLAAGGILESVLYLVGDVPLGMFAGDTLEKRLNMGNSLNWIKYLVIGLTTMFFVVVVVDLMFRHK